MSTGTVRPAMKLFSYMHLPEHLAKVSKPFGDLAYLLDKQVVDNKDEMDMALRKLLEAKDCAVRTAM